jgi:hypothetical protein
MIVTTNYDTLIERALHERCRAFQVVMTPIDRPSGERVASGGRPALQNPLFTKALNSIVLPKMCRSFTRFMVALIQQADARSCVITEDDYFEIGGRIYESSLDATALSPRAAARRRAHR